MAFRAKIFLGTRHRQNVQSLSGPLIFASLWCGWPLVQWRPLPYSGECREGGGAGGSDAHHHVTNTVLKCLDFTPPSANIFSSNKTSC